MAGGIDADGQARGWVLVTGGEGPRAVPALSPPAVLALATGLILGAPRFRRYLRAQ